MQRARYRCKGLTANHISSFQNKYVLMTANEKQVNIYKESYSTNEPFQTLTVGKITCSLVFHDLWILGGDNGANTGLLTVLKLVRKKSNNSGAIVEVFEQMSYYDIAIDVTCISKTAKLESYIIIGTSQGFIIPYRVDVDTGSLTLTARVNQSLMMQTLQFNKGTVHSIIPTSRGDYAAVTERGLSFFEFDKTSNHSPIVDTNKSMVFQGKRMTLVCECSPTIFVLASIDVPHFVKVDRAAFQTAVILDQSQKSNEHGYTDL